MANKQLIQKTLSSKKEVNIREDHLAVHNKNLQEDIEYIIKFEELGFDTVKRKVKTANIPFYFFLGFTALNIYLMVATYINNGTLAEQMIWIMGFVFFASFMIYSLTQRNKQVIYLSGGKKVLELFSTKPDKQTVLDFIDEVHEAVRTYYKKKHLNFDFDTPFETKNATLKWLKEIEVITENEFDVLIASYKAENIIGFKWNNN